MPKVGSVHTSIHTYYPYLPLLPGLPPPLSPYRVCASRWQVMLTVIGLFLVNLAMILVQVRGAGQGTGRGG